MKNTVVLAVALTLVLLVSSAAGAMMFQVDGLYLLGNSDSEFAGATMTTKGLNFSAGVQAEVFPDILADARYLFSAADSLQVGDEFEEFGDNSGYKADFNLITGGIQYRVMEEDGIGFFVGAGYALLSGEYKRAVEVGAATEGDGGTLSGSSFYGKARVAVDVNRDVSFYGDLAFAPMVKNFALGSADDGEGSILSARGGVVYHINEMLGIQAGVDFSSAKAEFADADNFSVSSVLYGAGVVVRF